VASDLLDYDNGKFAIGFQTSSINQYSARKYFYNAMERVASINESIDGYDYTIKYEYDVNGHIKSVIYPSGLKVSYTLNSNGRREKIDSSVGLLISDIKYLPYGPVSSMQFANGVILQKKYDLNYSVIGLDYSGLVSYRYQRDEMGNITKIIDQNDDTYNQYHYDNLDRLIMLSSVFNDLEYDYDEVGNRTEISDQIYTYTKNSNHLSKIKGKNAILLSYDLNGNIIQKGEDWYFYNLAG